MPVDKLRVRFHCARPGIVPTICARVKPSGLYDSNCERRVWVSGSPGILSKLSQIECIDEEGNVGDSLYLWPSGMATKSAGLLPRYRISPVVNAQDCSMAVGKYISQTKNDISLDRVGLMTRFSKKGLWRVVVYSGDTKAISGVVNVDSQHRPATRNGKRKTPWDSICQAAKERCMH